MREKSAYRKLHAKTEARSIGIISLAAAGHEPGRNAISLHEMICGGRLNVKKCSDSTWRDIASWDALRRQHKLPELVTPGMEGCG